MAITTREAEPGDLDALLALRNAIFPAITRAGWEREQPSTACVAFDGGEMVGALPLAFREIKIGPGRTVTTVFENAVGTRADSRGRGVGSAMIGGIRAFMRGRADALFVYRGDERSIGYAFYAKTGHVDLHYTRRHVLARPQTPAVPVPGVVIRDGVEGILAQEAECMALFQATFSGHGGFRDRVAGYYRKALEGLIYECHPQQFQLVQYREDRAVLAYAIIGRPTRPHATPLVSILEMGTANGASAYLQPVLAAVAGLAAERGLPVHCTTSDPSPFVPALDAAGFAAQPRHHMTMAILLRYPAATARKVWIAHATLRNVTVVAWTPAGEWVLHQAPEATARTLRLEMKDETLTRLLLGRVRVVEAVGMELITVMGAAPGDLAALASALPFAPWCYHAIDYI